jgi:hypothetical protein
MQPFTCGGDVRVAAHLSTILADAPKDRSADFLAEAKDHPDLADFALRMANTPAEVVLSSMRDSALPLPCRAIAARFASGLESCGEASKDHLNALLASFREISVPEDLVAATSIAAARTREPITVMVPLIWLAAQASKETRVCDSPGAAIGAGGRRAALRP